MPVDVGSHVGPPVFNTEQLMCSLHPQMSRGWCGVSPRDEPSSESGGTQVRPGGHAVGM